MNVFFRKWVKQIVVRIKGFGAQVISRSPPTGNCAGAKPLRAREPHQPYSSGDLYAAQFFLVFIFWHKQNCAGAPLRAQEPSQNIREI